MVAKEIPQQKNEKYVFRAAGTCPLCEKETEFIAESEIFIPLEWHRHWFRDCLKCVHCESIPRERVIFDVLNTMYPNWRELRIHESSPSPQGASLKLMNECPGYMASQYDPTIGFGKYNPEKKYQSENLEHQTFDAESFDIVITQDVFEHLFAPDLAIQEIARTLKIGGSHILTVPIVMGKETSRRRARMDESGIKHLLEPQYHGNPLSSDGSLVTIDWGNDIVDYLAAHSGLTMSLFNIDDLNKGIRAVYNEVLVCRKMGVAPTL